ncbi:MAG TPA: 1,2-phenylacetyl-CoA epoxidase subunit PaaC [Burkholderiaceae bacterium]|nr:1,2-phenylacetyl-CoA epoxidase subunit PaaC [Burkholderiaceae bacterium]
MSQALVRSAAEVQYLLRIGDSSLILGQRLAEWCGHGPILEEDIALTNVGLDLIGQARLLLSAAGDLEGRGRDEDQLAFLRPEHEYVNATLVELPNGDFARTVLRNFLFAAFQAQLWNRLRASSHAPLAAIAAKSAKETAYHLRHAADWTVRLGDGTDESGRRMRSALEYLWPYTNELFARMPEDEAIAASGFGVAWSALQPPWESAVLPVLARARLAVPAHTPFVSSGTSGQHSEHMGHVLSELQYLQRTYPGCQW